jgi:hypothetical protein
MLLLQLLAGNRFTADFFDILSKDIHLGPDHCCSVIVVPQLSGLRPLRLPGVCLVLCCCLAAGCHKICLQGVDLCPVGCHLSLLYGQLLLELLFSTQAASLPLLEVNLA